MVHGRKWRVVFGIRWDGGKRPRVIIGALTALIAAFVPASAQAHAVDAGQRAALRSVFVVPAAGRTADARALVCRLGGHSGRRIAVARGFVARVPGNRLATLRGNAAVRAASPDVDLSLRGDDAVQTAASAGATVRAAAGLQALRDAGIDGKGVGIALVDSGAMDIDGLDGGQLVKGPDFSSDDEDADLRGLDGFGHGTHLAGVIAGHDGAGLDGVAPGARVLSVKVANAGGQTSLLRVLAALDWIRKNQAAQNIRVVNLSLGVDADDVGYVRDPLAFAAEQLWRKGLVVVAAAGNNGANAVSLDIPAADPFVLAVGALDTAGTPDTGDDAVASFSSRNASRTPDVVAPGTGIVSLRVPGSTLDMAFPKARIGERYMRGSGTSQATAVVSGTIALLLQQRPDLQPDQVKALLTSGARSLGADASAQGAGALDAARSASLATPAAKKVAQHGRAAVLDVRQLGAAGKVLRKALGNARWNGSTWSGSTWSGSTWSGSTWSGSTWSGSTWSGSTWSGSTWSSASWDGGS
jgi:serine protease AprX